MRLGRMVEMVRPRRARDDLRKAAVRIGAAAVDAGGGRAHAILVPEAHERSWGQKSGVMEEENGGIEV